MSGLYLQSNREPWKVFEPESNGSDEEMREREALEDSQVSQSVAGEVGWEWAPCSRLGTRKRGRFQEVTMG